MQALGSYRRGRLLFLGLGTGLGAALVLDGLPLDTVPLDVEEPAEEARLDHGVELVHGGGEAPVEAGHRHTPGAGGGLR